MPRMSSSKVKVTEGGREDAGVNLWERWMTEVDGKMDGNCGLKRWMTEVDRRDGLKRWIVEMHKEVDDRGGWKE